MKAIILIAFLSLILSTQAQTKKTSRGYTIVLDGLYLRVDTIEHKTYIYNHRRGKWSRKVFIQINGGAEHYLVKGGVYMAWNDRFVLTVKRNGIVKSYKVCN